MNREADMQLGTEPLLEQHRIFHSRHVGEARAYLEHKEFHLEINPRWAGELDMRINGVYLPGMWFGYFQYGLPVATRAVGRDDYWIQMPVCGQIEVIGSSSTAICDSRHAAVLSPTHTDFYLVRSSSRCGRLCLSLTKASLVGQLAALLGELPTAPLDFAPTIDLATGYGRSLARYVLMAVADLEQAGSVLWSPTTMRTFEQFITTALLLSHPHNYSNALRCLEKSIAPRDVRRAVDYIEAHLDQAITVADLVVATGVAGRTLFMHFKSFKGVSPMRYARDARLRQVRQALLRAEPDASVTEIAMSTGFTHMGRFSVEYRRRFGETPSQTLKQRHQRGRLMRNSS
jgi:AraC-like DNA-binding protein